MAYGYHIPNTIAIFLITRLILEVTNYFIIITLLTFCARWFYWVVFSHVYHDSSPGYPYILVVKA